MFSSSTPSTSVLACFSGSNRQARTHHFAGLRLVCAMLLAGLLLIGAGQAAHAQEPGQPAGEAVNATLVVNDAGDAADADTGDGVCDADLATPGLQCTLRAAIQEANVLPGLDAIHFDLPADNLIIQPATALPQISEAVVVDGSTQPGAVCPTPLVRLDGALTGGSTDGLTISGGGSTVRGLMITRFAGSGVVLDGGSGTMLVCNMIGTDTSGAAGLGNGEDGVRIVGSGNNQIGGVVSADRNVIAGNDSSQILLTGALATGNQIQGNTIGADPSGTVDITSGGGIDLIDAPNNVIGGASPGAGNHIAGSNFSGISLAGSGTTGTVVQGNLIGLDSSGAVALGNTYGISFINVSGALIGGSAAGAGNTISGNGIAGIYLTSNSDANQIEGNIIGLDVSGFFDVGNGYHGIVLEYADGNTIGGSTAGAGNTVSGNNSQGVLLVASQGNTIAGNKIGTDTTGVALLGNTLNGILLNSGASNNTIGGPLPEDGNVIAGNGQNGVTVVNPPTWTTNHNAIHGNRIFGNGALGIDLENDGVTANDPEDGDSGANDLQNFPVLTTATRDGTTVTVDGILDTIANTPVSIDIYYASSCDPSGYGEGEQMLGSFTGMTDGSGQWTFHEVLASAAPAGAFLTATATDAAGNTSEFSACVSIQAVPPPCTPGPHSGTISADQRWCAADSPHQMTGDVTVAPGVTLTVEAGAVVKGSADVELNVQGHLEAAGTAGQPILFTSAVDTEYNQWSGIVFDGTAGGGTGHLDYATVRYGGRPNSINPTCGSSGLGFNIAARNVQAGEVHIRNSQVRSVGYQCNFHSPDYGLYVDNSRVVVENTTFANNGVSNTGDYAIYVAGAASTLNLAGNTFTANKNNRVLVASGAMTGADVTFVAEEGLESYELAGDLTVPAGITMTVEPGVMVMGRTHVEVRTLGHLVAIGTPTQPITFTSATNTGGNQWSGLVFDGGTGELDYTTVRYGGRPSSLNTNCNSGGMGFNVGVRNVLAGEVRIRNSQIRSAAFNCNFDSRDYGLYVSNSRVTVQNTLFANNGNSNTTNPSSGDFAVYASGASTVLTFDGNVVRNNRRGLQLNGVGALTLRNNVFKDNPLGGVYIAASAQAQLLHSTFAGNGGDAVTVASGGSAALTNSIIANNGAGVRVNTGGAGTLERTLWYGNGTNTVGTVGQTGSLTGAPLFAGDGYHLTHLSPALEQGVDAGMAVDIDGEARPLPAGTGPDLGADEYDAAQELVFAKIALPPVWEVTGAIPGGSLTQRYLLPFRYGSPDPNAAPLDVTVSDTLPAALSLVNQTHWPPMSFSQNGQTLTWQTEAPLARGQSGMIDITTIYANPQPGQVLTNTAALNTLAAQAVTEVPLYAPTLVTPGTGELCPGTVDIRGMAQPGVTVHLFIDGAPLAQIATNAAGEFSTTYSYGGSATETLTAQACVPGGACSAASTAVTLRPPQSFWCPQRSIWEGTPAVGPKAGQHLVFQFRNNSGEFSSQNWRIPGVYGFWNTTLHLHACNCPPASGTTAPPSSVWVIADGVRYDPTGSHPDYTFAVTGGAHNVVFWADCGGNFVSSTGVILIDPDGYVFDVTQGFDPQDPTAHAIDGVTVTLYELVPEWGGWTPWPAHLYNNQANPQVTGADGYFAFFTPPGQYYLHVDGKPGYQPWRSPVITVVNEIVHVNVPYTPWTEPPAVETVTEILLTVSGPQPASVIVPAGTTVQWRAEVDSLLPPAELATLAENPVLHPLSVLNPLSSTFGWDGGMLQPGQIYQRQMNHAGRYTYSDGLGNEAEICVDACAPLVVTLAAFEATAQPDHILVNWETVSELNNAGFNLYRSLDGEWGSAALLGFVPSQAPGSTQGAAYAWQDVDVAAGQTAWYWLEDVDLGGVATLHGPVSATMLAPTAVTLMRLDATAANRGALPWWLSAAFLALLAVPLALRYHRRA